MDRNGCMRASGLIVVSRKKKPQGAFPAAVMRTVVRGGQNCAVSASERIAKMSMIQRNGGTSRTLPTSTLMIV